MNEAKMTYYPTLPFIFSALSSDCAQTDSENTKNKCADIIQVLPVKTLEPKCTTENNSPAARPEFVDISMIVTTEPENGLPVDGVRENMTKCILYSEKKVYYSIVAK